MAKQTAANGSPIPTAFRLHQETLDHLDTLIDAYHAETGLPQTRSSALRQAVYEAVMRRQKKSRKKTH